MTRHSKNTRPTQRMVEGLVEIVQYISENVEIILRYESTRRRNGNLKHNDWFLFHSNSPREGRSLPNQSEDL